MDVPQHRRCASRLPAVDRLLLFATTAASVLITATLCSASKAGVYFERSPESTIAPLRDEVLFSCELNLEPDRLEWRFRPSVPAVPLQTHHMAIGGGAALSSAMQLQQRNEYIYLNKSVIVCGADGGGGVVGFDLFISNIPIGGQSHNLSQDGYNISTNQRVSKLRIDVGQNSAGDYQCLAWFGPSAVASIPARLTFASIALDAVRAAADEMPPSERSWHVQAGNVVLVKCAPVVSNPPAVWSFYK